MSKQLMSLTVRLDPKDKQVAFFRLDGVGIRQFTQLSTQYRRIKKVDAATKAEVIRWIIAQYTDTPCDRVSLQSYCKAQNIRLLRLFELALCVAMQKHIGEDCVGDGKIETRMVADLGGNWRYRNSDG